LEIENTKWEVPACGRRNTEFMECGEKTTRSPI
jgi:hypothetical protein